MSKNNHKAKILTSHLIENKKSPCCKLTLLKTTKHFSSEIEPATWKKTQISLLTAALRQNEECVPAIVSDLSHSKEAALINLEKLLSGLLSSDVKAWHIWSDGPSSQFKNCFILSFMV